MPVENVTTATFKCVFPVCGGICCKNGRPGLETYQAEKIEANLGKFLPHLRPTARKHVEKHGWLTHRTKEAPVAPATKEDHVSAAQPAVCGYASPETTMHPKANARKR